MIKFTDKRLFLKGVGNVLLADPNTGKICYQSDMFSAGQITHAMDMNEIRAGLLTPIVAVLPSNKAITVEFTAADFNLWNKTAAIGGELTYGAPVPVAQTVTASGTSLSIDVSGGTPVAQLGMNDVVCYVQQVGAASPIASGGQAYAIDPSTGAISGFVATNGVQYKVWYFIQKATVQKATIYTESTPPVVHMTAAFAVYANLNGGAGQSGTRVGWLYYVIPMLQMQPSVGLSGDQANADTTVTTGMALADTSSVVSAITDECGEAGSTLAYMVYSPCVDADVIQGLAVVGGVVSLPVSSTAQIPVRFVMPDNSLVVPPSYATGFTYTGSGLPTGTTVSSSGLLTSSTTAGDGEVVCTYTEGETSYSVPVNVTVTSA